MKNTILSYCITIICSIQILNAQKTPLAYPEYEFTYYVQGDGGANGLTVTYNPDNGYYYCIQAGNADFPLEVFTNTGTAYYATTAKVDARGFWYNPQKKCFEGTQFVSGAFMMYPNSEGIPSNPIFAPNSSKFVPPIDQSVVVCNLKKKELYAYNDGLIYVYNQNSFALKKKIKVTKLPVSYDYINPYALIYTGYKNYEFALYDAGTYQLLFLNSKGVFTKSIQTPVDAPYADYFRLGFCNDRLFMYDGDTRSWTCYKLFAVASGN